jgi:hypothetical protein
MLRLGLCRPEDWSGSAVDFVERGFKRFAKLNGSSQANRIWSGHIQIMDHPFDLTERERNSMEGNGVCNLLYLVGEFDAAASIPIGATLTALEREHPDLPAAFYTIFRQNLWKWMRVYDHTDALEHAQLWMEDLDEENQAESIYPKVAQNIPACLKNHSPVSKKRARVLLNRAFSSRNSTVSELARLVLEMDALGQGYQHAWACKLVAEIPQIGDWLNDAEHCGPGCLISWYENDEVSACFDEEMRDLGANGSLEPAIVLPIHLDRPQKPLDAEIQRVFDHIGAMLGSLAAAAKIVEIIRELYDEYLRQHRFQQGLQAEPGAAGVRDQ